MGEMINSIESFFLGTSYNRLSGRGRFSCSRELPYRTTLHTLIPLIEILSVNLDDDDCLE